MGKSTPVSTSLDPGVHDALMVPAKYDATLRVDGLPFYAFASTSATFAKGVSRLQVGAEWNMDKTTDAGRFRHIKALLHQHERPAPSVQFDSRYA